MSGMQPTVGRSDEIPKSFTESPERPFEMVGVRDQYLKEFDRNNQRLTEEQVQQLANEPTITRDTSRIDNMTKEANETSQQAFEERKLYNLSMKEIAFRLSDTWHDIIDGLLHFDTSDGFRGFIDVFIREDRLIYIGITLMIFSIASMLIRSV